MYAINYQGKWPINIDIHTQLILDAHKIVRINYTLYVDVDTPNKYS